MVPFSTAVFQYSILGYKKKENLYLKKKKKHKIWSTGLQCWSTGISQTVIHGLNN